MTFAGILTGLVIGCVLNIGFILYCLYHAKRYPLIPEQHEHVSADHVETTVYAPPAYGLRVVPK